VLRQTLESLEKGREYLEQAIAVDPDYALAHAGMAEYYFLSACWGDTGPTEVLPKVKAAAMEALGRDDMLAEAHAILGVARGIGDFDWAGAEPEIIRAVELNPASPTIRLFHGFWFLRPVGRVDEALSQAQRAVELDPLSALCNNVLAYMYYVTGQHEEAIAQYQRAMDLDPGWYFPHFLLAIAYQHMERVEEGLSEARKACELSGRNALTLGVLGLGHGLAGQASEARAVLEALMNQRRTAYVSPWAIAVACRGVGEMGQTLQWLERGVEEHDIIEVTGLKSDPRYAMLHGHPRYQAMLRKMNLLA
jgi:tetratricopeptide (TPR) repeat protein